MPYRPGVDSRLPSACVSRRALLAGGLAVAAGVPLVGCAGGGSVGRPHVLAADVPRAVPGSDAPTGAVTAGMATFAHRLMGAAAPTANNFVMSPLSIACAFAMARVGAMGSTGSQLDRVFGFPESGRDDAFNAITRDLVTTAAPPVSRAWKPPAPPPPPLVAVGDALFIDNGLPVGAGFLRTLAAQYGAGARTVDFMSRGALEQINAWVRDQTAGRITRIFEALDPSTQLVLANTVYFKAYWKSMFERPMTQPARFTRGDGSPVTADMMTSVVSARYARVGGFQAVELPYFGGSYAMWLAIPPAGRRPLDAVEPATVAAVTGAMGTERLTVSLPRFDFAAGLDLAETLPALGLTIPFGASADFSGIAPGLFISQAAHRANIAVTEDGTEAAAATGIAMATSGQMPPSLSFVADRPFAFMIVGGADRVPLFVGQVADPTAK